MTYAFRPGRPFTDDFRAIAAEQLTEAVMILEDRPQGLHEAIHDARKNFKRLRSLYRLVAADAPQFQKYENARIRDMARNFEFRYDGPGGRGFGTWIGRGRLGVQLMPLTDQLAATFGVKGGAMVTTVEADSPAGRAGLRAGDIIMSINNRTVDDVSDVLNEVNRARDGDSLAITVMRDRKEMTLNATIPERERPAVRRRTTI